jgi:hypothetical protein
MRGAAELRPLPVRLSLRQARFARCVESLGEATTPLATPCSSVMLVLPEYELTVEGMVP